MENRAYYLTISIQRWLSIRLDLFGNILILGIGLFAAGFRRTVDPSKIGVVLSYTMSSKYRDHSLNARRNSLLIVNSHYNFL